MLKKKIGLTLITAILMLAVSLNCAIAAQKPSPVPEAIQDRQGPEIFVQTGHSSSIISAFFTSDGRYLVSCGEDKTIKIWEAATGREIRTLFQSDKMSACAVFPDNQKILAGDEKGNLHLWNMETGKSLGKFTGKSPGTLATVSISPDGRHAASTHAGGALAYWDTANKKQIFVLDRYKQSSAKGSAYYIKAAAFLSDNNRIALGIEVVDQPYKYRGFNIEIYDIKKRKTVRTHEILKGEMYITSFAVSPDGKYFFASLADAKSGQTGNFISTSRDGTLRLWGLAAGAEIAQFITFTDGEWIVITPEGYFNASPGGAKHLNVRVGNQVYSIDNFYEKFFNPVYVASVLQSRKVEVSADVRAGILTPPEIRIVSPELNATFATDTISITVLAKDTGGGIDEIRLLQEAGWRII